MEDREWYRIDVGEALTALGSSADGLTPEEARERLDKHGPNELTEKAGKRPLLMFLGQFTDFMIIVLIGAALVAGLIGELKDSIVILIIIIINAIVGFVQEYRAEKAMAALKQMAAPSATVVRAGVVSKVAASQVVPGDLVLLEAGAVVPADIRLMEAAQLKMEEAALTGESVPVDKQPDALPDPDLALADRSNMAYKGTITSYGRGKGVVVATGMETELGKIATMLQAEEEVKTPLQKRLAGFGRKLAFGVLIIAAIVFGLGVVRGEEPLLMLLTAISLAVAAIPEALPAVVTIALALGASKMVRQHALVKKLPAVETLGSVTYICSDKTGTLTTNRMTVEEVWAHGKAYGANDAGLRKHDELLAALSLSNDAQLTEEGRVVGDPTETALYVTAKNHGYDKVSLERESPRIWEIPFDSQRKCMTTFHRRNGRTVSFTKGAIDVMLHACNAIETDRGPEPIDRAAIEKVNEAMASRGLRVLGIAMREWPGDIPRNIAPRTAERDLTLLGLVGMLDPPRDEAREAVGLARSAGIKPVMITGDHPATARAVAYRVGILDAAEGAAVLTGRELEALPLEEFEQRVEGIKVYARVAPEQKLKIVRALQDRGQFVAMTGDGVNDAPALRRADIGIAMGITGTDVSKEAAHMILLDDNFATIVRAVREGRKIYDNIRKFIKYLLTTNSGEIWTLFLAPLIGLPIPLLPIHILWINLVTDGLPALALSLEPAEGDVMKRPPRQPKESLFAHGLGFHALWVGFLMALIALGTQAYAIRLNDPSWQTMVFTVLCLTQLGHVLAIRSERESLFRQGLLSNKTLLGAVFLTFALQMATVYVPFLNPIFRTQPLNIGEMALTLAASSLVFFAVEGEKWLKRHRSG